MTIELTLKQAQDIVDFFGGDAGDQEWPTTVTVGYIDGQPGLYAWMTEYPEEGCIPLNDKAAEFLDKQEQAEGEKT